MFFHVSFGHFVLVLLAFVVLVYRFSFTGGFTVRGLLSPRCQDPWLPYVRRDSRSLQSLGPTWPPPTPQLYSLDPPVLSREIGCKNISEMTYSVSSGMQYLNSINESFVQTDILTIISYEQLEQSREYSSAPTDDLVRFWRSKIKVTAGRWGREGIHVNTGALKSSSS